MRVTLSLANEVHAHLKQESRTSGRTMGDVLSDIVRQAIVQSDPDFVIGSDGMLKRSPTAETPPSRIPDGEATT